MAVIFLADISFRVFFIYKLGRGGSFLPAGHNIDIDIDTLRGETFASGNNREILELTFANDLFRNFRELGVFS